MSSYCLNESGRPSMNPSYTASLRHCEVGKFRGSTSDVEYLTTQKSTFREISQADVLTTIKTIYTDDSLSSIGRFYSHHASGSFPDELHKTIMNFIVAFLIEQPNDVIDYAVQHFRQIQASRRKRTRIEKYESKACAVVTERKTPNYEIKTPNTPEIACRRPSICAEQLNIEDEVFMEDKELELRAFAEKTPEQRERLENVLKNCFVFQQLEPEQMSRVVDVMYELRVKNKDIIMSQETAELTKFYAIETGIFMVYENNELIMTLNNCGTIGEIALLYQMNKVPTVVAASDGMLWAMDRLTFKSIIQSQVYKQQRVFDELLRNVKMFGVLSLYERLKLVEALVVQTYKPGDAIVRQGEEPDGMYFIMEGDCTVYLDQMKGKGEVIVNRLTNGDYFGELALLTHDKRRATVYAVNEVRVAFLDKESFERLLGKCIDILNRGIEDYNLKDAKIISYLEVQRTKSKIL